MFEQISVSTGNRWMALSLAFPICVTSRLKQIPGLSYPVHSLFQPSHCHSLSCLCLIGSAKEDVSVTFVTFPDYQSDSGEKRTKHLWTFLFQTWGRKWTWLLLPFMISIHWFSNISTVLSHTEKLFFWLIQELLEISQESVFSADFQTQEMSW